jgi:hypothetical protein
VKPYSCEMRRGDPAPHGFAFSAIQGAGFLVIS